MALKAPQRQAGGSNEGNNKSFKLISFPILTIFSSLVLLARNYLLRHVSLGTEQLVKLQKQFKHPFLDKYFLVASLCGSETFYTLLLPLLFWTVNADLARSIAVMLTAGIYLSNVLKNLLCLPRPPSPPVWNPNASKETLDNRDYGWPSSHSVNAVSLPFFTLRFFYGFVWVWEYENPLVLTAMYAFAFWWSGSIIFSRMYLGVHSPADVQGGMILGVVILRLFLSVCDAYSVWVLSGAYVPLIVHCIGALTLLVHPQSAQAETFSFAESTSIIGWLAGIICGNWMSQISAGSYVALPPSLFMLWKPIARFILGIVITIPIYLISKKILVTLVHGPNYQAPKEKPKRDLNFKETVIKFLAYSSIGWTTTYFAPLLFTALNIW